MSVQLILYPQNYKGKYTSALAINQYVADNVNFITLLSHSGYLSSQQFITADAINNDSPIAAWKRFRPSSNSFFADCPLPSRSNTNKLEWEYVKDESLSSGEDIVAIDGVKIIETIPGTPIIGSYVFRLEDTQEGDGKVLTSDADGNATWKSTSISRSSGKLDSGLNNELTNKPDEDFTQKTNAVFLNQQEKIKQLKNKISDLKKLANKLIKENK